MLKSSPQSVNVVRRYRPATNWRGLVVPINTGFRQALSVAVMLMGSIHKTSEYRSTVILRNSDAWPLGASENRRVTRMIAPWDDLNSVGTCVWWKWTHPLGRQPTLAREILQSFCSKLKIEDAPSKTSCGLPTEKYVHARHGLGIEKDDQASRFAIARLCFGDAAPRTIK